MEKEKRTNLFEWYKEKFLLDKETINELAQKNFNLYRRFIIFLAVYSFLDFFIYLFVNISDLVAVLPKLIYFGSFLLITIIMYIYCLIVKNCDRNKNFILKNVPFYFTGLCTYLLTLYNFFIFGTHLNGLLIYEIISLIALLLYDYEPLLFFIFNIFPFGLMLPVFYEEYGLGAIGDILVFNSLMVIFSFVKRFNLKKHTKLINSQKNNIKIITFGNFTILHNQVVVKFQRKKSLELLAYLVSKKGSSVDSKELMNILWGERATSSEYGSSLRNLIVDIKQSLKKLGIMDFFITEYNSFRINPSVVDCDYYNLLENKKDSKETFSGEFMSQFSWAEDTCAYLESLIK